MALSISSIDERMADEYGAVGGFRIGKGTEIFGVLLKRHIISHMTLPEIKPELP
jgi:hypothetical protein